MSSPDNCCYVCGEVTFTLRKCVLTANITRQALYVYITLRCVHETIAAVEKQ
jgi:hypothetical protein